jgi:hypothetical protein
VVQSSQLAKAIPTPIPPQNISLVRALKQQAANFPQQLQVIKDKSKRIAIFVPRRGAKTSSVVLLYLMYALMYSNIRLVFIGLTGESAENAFLPHAEQFLAACHIYENQHYHYNRTERLFTFLATNSVISLKGFDMSYKEMDKILGGKCFSVAIDECQSHTQDLETAIKRKVGPALSDYLPIGGGSLFLLGTAGDYMGENFWYQVVVSPNHLGWSFHTWEGKDNPHMTLAKEMEDEDFLKMYGPEYKELDWYKQQYLNQWISSGKRMVYQYSTRNVLGSPECVTSLPPANYFERAAGACYGLGMDWGFSPDPMAFIVVCYNTRYDNKMYIISEHKQNEMYPVDIYNYIKLLDGKYHFSFMVADAGAQAKAQVSDLNTNYGLHIETADKAGKLAHINTFNGDLRSGSILVSQDCKQLVNEWSNLIWDPISLNTRNTREEKAGLPNDLCLVAGTKIQTINGPKNIEDIIVGELVLTSSGYQPVIAANMTGIHPIWELLTRKGKMLRGNANHPIFVDGEYFPLCELKTGDILTCIEQQQEHTCQTMENQLPSNTMELPIGGIPSQNIDRIASTGAASTSMALKPDIYIAPFMLNIMAPFLMAIMFITLMKTHLIMIPLICSLLVPLIMLVCMGWNAGRTQTTEKQHYNSWHRLMIWLRNGITHPKAWNGISNMARNVGKVKKPFIHILARYVSKFSILGPKKPMSVPTSVLPSNDEIVALTMKHESAQSANKSSRSISIVKQYDAVESVSTIGISLPVYNLTVANQHNYYANGVLCHNCDATLYAHFYCRHNWFKAKPAPISMSDQFTQTILKGEQKLTAFNRLEQGKKRFSPYNIKPTYR